MKDQVSVLLNNRSVSQQVKGQSLLGSDGKLWFYRARETDG